MDWQIKTLSKKSTLSGERFNPGDRAVSLIYVDAAGRQFVLMQVGPPEFAGSSVHIDQ